MSSEAISTSAAAQATTAEAQPTQEQQPASAQQAHKVDPATVSKEKESQRFAALAKKERTLVKRQEELKQLQESIATKEAEYKAYQEAKQEALRNPLKFLEAHGLTYEQITNFVLNGEKPTPDLEVQSVRKELSEFKRQQEEERKNLLEQEKQKLAAEEARVIQEFHDGVVDFVKQNGSDYELINLNESHGLVIEVIQQHFAATQKVMTAKEAADLVEDYLVKQVEKNLATKKLAAKAQPQPEADSQQSNKATPRTLTNQLTSSAPSFLPAKTEQDRLKRAMAALDRK